MGAAPIIIVFVTVQLVHMHKLGFMGCEVRSNSPARHRKRGLYLCGTHHSRHCIKVL